MLVPMLMLMLLLICYDGACADTDTDAGNAKGRSVGCDVMCRISLAQNRDMAVFAVS